MAGDMVAIKKTAPAAIPSSDTSQITINADNRPAPSRPKAMIRAGFKSETVRVASEVPSRINIAGIIIPDRIFAVDITISGTVMDSDVTSSTLATNSTTYRHTAQRAAVTHF